MKNKVYQYVHLKKGWIKARDMEDSKTFSFNDLRYIKKMNRGSMFGNVSSYDLFYNFKKTNMKRFINKWKGNEFESSTTLTDEYKSFNRGFKKIISDISKRLGGEIIGFKPNHFNTSGFIKNDNKYIYISISDVRHFRDGWLNDILYRTAEHSKDYTGGSNHSSKLEGLEDNINNLFNNI